MIYLILLFTILFFFFAWRRLDWAIMLLIVCLPAYLIRFKVLGLPLTLLEVMIWSVFIVWFIANLIQIKTNLHKLFKTEKDGTKIRYPYDWEIVLLLIITLAAAGVAGFSSSSLGIWKAYFFEPVLLFIVVINVMAGRLPSPPFARRVNITPLAPLVGGAELVLWPLAVSAIVVSVLAIYQKFTGALIDNPVWAAEETRRVVSFFGYPNAVGLYLGPLVLVMAGWFFSIVEVYFCHSRESSPRAPLARALATCHRSFRRSAGWNSEYHHWLFRRVSGLRPRLAGAMAKRVGGRNDNKIVAHNDKIKIIFIGLTIILSVLSIYFTKSKGALLGVVAGLVVFSLMADRKTRWATAVLVIVVAAGAVAYQPARSLALRNITFTNLSGQIRQAGWSDAWRMLKDGRLLTGAGLANYQAAVAPYHTEGIFIKDYNDPGFQRKLVFNEAYREAHWQPLEIYLYPHNIMLNFWSELGLVGLLLFVWVIGKYFWMGLKLEIGNWKLGIINKFQILNFKFFNIGLICAMVVIIVHGIVDAPYFKNDLAVMFWLLVAMMSLMNLEKNYGKNI